jgi:hypothetical protein
MADRSELIRQIIALNQDYPVAAIPTDDVLEGTVIPPSEMKRCGTCHLVKDDVQRVTDPYDHDVNDVDIEVLLCGGCYAERLDDV